MLREIGIIRTGDRYRHRRLQRLHRSGDARPRPAASGARHRGPRLRHARRCVRVGSRRPAQRILPAFVSQREAIDAAAALTFLSRPRGGGGDGDRRRRRRRRFVGRAPPPGDRVSEWYGPSTDAQTCSRARRALPELWPPAGRLIATRGAMRPLPCSPLPRSSARSTRPVWSSTRSRECRARAAARRRRRTPASYLTTSPPTGSAGTSTRRRSRERWVFP